MRFMGLPTYGLLLASLTFTGLAVPTPQETPQETPRQLAQRNANTLFKECLQNWFKPGKHVKDTWPEFRRFCQLISAYPAEGSEWVHPYIPLTDREPETAEELEAMIEKGEREWAEYQHPPRGPSTNSETQRGSEPLPFSNGLKNFKNNLLRFGTGFGAIIQGAKESSQPVRGVTVTPPPGRLVAPGGI
ncbi:MAG: hypothetical protein M1816_003316 [Peltula sp. TS41687]|nr:MAG: hypothetical protein M1816_003316 [Peltula sp. TS41687]